MSTDITSCIIEFDRDDSTPKECENLDFEMMKQQQEEADLSSPPRELSRDEVAQIKKENLPPIPIYDYDRTWVPKTGKEEMLDLQPFTVKDFGNNKHSRTLHQNLMVPSMAQSYSLCIEYAKKWFLSLFERNPFKSVYVDGKNVFDDYRRMTAYELLKRERPALAIVPNFDWSFNNDNVDMYQFGTKLYRASGQYNNSFYKDWDHNSFLGIMMETLFMEFTFRIRLETRAQQLDMFSYLKLAGRIGNTMGENVDLDFHVPYDIILALAQDAGFEICPAENNSKQSYPRIVNVQAFLAHLNSHSGLPFLYKMRAINGCNEFFIRMHEMYVHVRPTNLSGDDGEREGHLNNNFNIEMTAEIRFPCPKFYAYYTENKKDFTTVYSGWNQPNGIISAFYTFKGIDVPNRNKYGWEKYLETTYEDDLENIGSNIDIDLSALLSERELGETIKHCLDTGISPSIFVDIVVINGGDFMAGKMDWSTMHFHSNTPAKSQNSYIAFYIDLMFINTYIQNARKDKDNRLQHTESPYDPYKDQEQKI